MSRHSVQQVLRSLRATRTSTARAAIRHAKQPDVSEQLARCLALLNEAERTLLGTNRRAAARDERRRRAAA